MYWKCLLLQSCLGWHLVFMVDELKFHLQNENAQTQKYFAMVWSPYMIMLLMWFFTHDGKSWHHTNALDVHMTDLGHI